MQENEGFIQQVPSKYLGLVKGGLAGIEKMRRKRRLKHYHNGPSQVRLKRYESGQPKAKVFPETSLDLDAILSNACGQIHQVYLEEGSTEAAAANANLALDNLMDEHDGYVAYSPYDNDPKMFRNYGWQVGYVPFAGTHENMVLIPIPVSNPD